MAAKDSTVDYSISDRMILRLDHLDTRSPPPTGDVPYEELDSSVPAFRMSFDSVSMDHDFSQFTTYILELRNCHIDLSCFKLPRNIHHLNLYDCHLRGDFPPERRFGKVEVVRIYNCVVVGENNLVGRCKAFRDFFEDVITATCSINSSHLIPTKARFIERTGGYQVAEVPALLADHPACEAVIMWINTPQELARAIEIYTNSKSLRPIQGSMNALYGTPEIKVDFAVAIAKLGRSYSMLGEVIINNERVYSEGGELIPNKKKKGLNRNVTSVIQSFLGQTPNEILRQSTHAWEEETIKYRWH